MKFCKPRTMDTQWRHKSKISEKLGRCGRLNMLPPYLKIWDWDWTFGRAVKTISSLGVCSPWFVLFELDSGENRVTFLFWFLMIVLFFRIKSPNFSYTYFSLRWYQENTTILQACLARKKKAINRLFFSGIHIFWRNH